MMCGDNGPGVCGHRRAVLIGGLMEVPGCAPQSTSNCPVAATC